jgi:hypothetical protein
VAPSEERARLFTVASIFGFQEVTVRVDVFIAARRFWVVAPPSSVVKSPPTYRVAPERAMALTPASGMKQKFGSSVPSERMCVRAEPHAVLKVPPKYHPPEPSASMLSTLAPKPMSEASERVPSAADVLAKPPVAIPRDVNAPPTYRVEPSEERTMAFTVPLTVVSVVGKFRTAPS